jgi:hypothetical protein
MRAPRQPCATASRSHVYTHAHTCRLCASSYIDQSTTDVSKALRSAAYINNPPKSGDIIQLPIISSWLLKDYSIIQYEDFCGKYMRANFSSALFSSAHIRGPRLLHPPDAGIAEAGQSKSPLGYTMMIIDPCIRAWMQHCKCCAQIFSGDSIISAATTASNMRVLQSANYQLERMKSRRATAIFMRICILSLLLATNY